MKVIESERPTYSIHTLGCRANQSDSERLAEILVGAGFSEVPFGQPATCQIVNSCTVTREADRKSAQMVRRAERLGGTVVATGCGVAARGGLKGGGSVLRLPPDQRDDILKLLGVESCPSSLALEGGLLSKQKRTRALLRIQDGCDQFCTFCIVPYVRGRSRSHSIETVVEQAKQLTLQGFQEIVLTGIHLSAWGQDFEGELRLNHLLEELLKAIPDVQLRLGSVEPDLFPVEVFDLMKAYPERLCPHLHLVIQHASDSILERMHRGYTLEHYRQLVDQFFGTVPLACLTTDVMVGFPGETDQDFKVLCNYIKSTPYYHLHVFPYSMRPGTAASKFSDQVSPEIKNGRRDILLKLGDKQRREVLRGLVGQQLTVLVEEECATRGWVQGRGHNFVAVKLRGGPAMLGTRCRVRITHFRGEFCFGQLL